MLARYFSTSQNVGRRVEEKVYGQVPWEKLLVCVGPILLYACETRTIAQQAMKTLVCNKNVTSKKNARYILGRQKKQMKQFFKKQVKTTDWFESLYTWQEM